MDSRLHWMIEEFVRRFERPPEAGAMAPGRVDLMGSHTDYNEGFVMTMAIDRDTRIIAASRTDRQAHIVSANLQSRTFFELDDSTFGQTAPWGKYVWGVTQALKDAGYSFSGFDALVHGTLPIGSGLSSSASMEAATSILLEQLGGFELTPLARARLCQKAENAWVGVPCGILDPYSSIFGQHARALVLDCRSQSHQYVPVPTEFVPVICDTCRPRELAGSEYAERRSECMEAVRCFRRFDPTISALRDVSLEWFDSHQHCLPKVVNKRARFVIEENSRVHELAEALVTHDRTSVGRIMADSFRGAKELYEICNPSMLAMHEAMASAPGCVGCRQAGAGFGGCMIALVEHDSIEAFADAVMHSYHSTSRTVPVVFPVRSVHGAGALDLDS